MASGLVGVVPLDCCLMDFNPLGTGSLVGVAPRTVGVVLPVGGCGLTLRGRGLPR